MGPFHAGKEWLVEQLDLSKDALHVHIGLGVFILAAILFRRPLGDPRPLAAALLAALFGEVFDFFARVGERMPPEWGGSWHDLWNTMFWPAMLFLLARSPRVLRTHASGADETEGSEVEAVDDASPGDGNEPAEDHHAGERMGAALPG